MWTAERYINIWSEAECMLARVIFLVVCFWGQERQNEEKVLSLKHENQQPFPRQHLPSL